MLKLSIFYRVLLLPRKEFNKVMTNETNNENKYNEKLTLLGLMVPKNIQKHCYHNDKISSTKPHQYKIYKTQRDPCMWKTNKSFKNILEQI